MLLLLISKINCILNTYFTLALANIIKIYRKKEKILKKKKGKLVTFIYSTSSPCATYEEYIKQRVIESKKKQLLCFNMCPCHLHACQQKLHTNTSTLLLSPSGEVFTTL